MLHQGRCQCGNLKIEVELPLPLTEYSPRQCDCEFCVSRQLAYLSDPDGILFLSTRAFENSKKQGSQQAEFLSCPECQLVIAAIYESADGVKGALNAQVLTEHKSLLPAQQVSPKQLAPYEKVSRWEKLWMSVVKVDK